MLLTCLVSSSILTSLPLLARCSYAVSLDIYKDPNGAQRIQFDSSVCPESNTLRCYNTSISLENPRMSTFLAISLDITPVRGYIQSDQTMSMHMKALWRQASSESLPLSGTLIRSTECYDNKCSSALVLKTSDFKVNLLIFICIFAFILYLTKH